MTRAGDSDDLGNRAITTSACRLRSPLAASVSASAVLAAIAEPTDTLDAFFSLPLCCPMAETLVRRETRMLQCWKLPLHSGKAEGRGRVEVS